MGIWFQIACEDAGKCVKMGLPDSGMLISDKTPQLAVCDELERYGVVCQPAGTNDVEVCGIFGEQEFVWICDEV